MTTIPFRDDADYAEQSSFVDSADYDIGMDTAALAPAAENLRAAVDPADTVDRIEQSLIIPMPDDDYPFAY
ncbi:hypothetical protein [Nocardia sp. NPDC057030]|uniref:hypothetical protein n=1 Tax=unclassified Nocardia TaxID=2637762 RepID=UPI0036303076